MHPLQSYGAHHFKQHVETHKHIIIHFQHGFQPGLSCESQLIETVHDWMTAMDNKTQIDAILLDFAKAFNKVPHKRLLSKLAFYGITGNTKLDQIVSIQSQTESLSQWSPVGHHKCYIWCTTGLSP